MYGLELNELCSGLFSDVMDKMGYRNQIIVNLKRNKPMVSFFSNILCNFALYLRNN